MGSKVIDSRYWGTLWERYELAPSVAFCRVPELEFASTLDISGKALDHGCGDGYFSTLAWPNRKFWAGCDINKKSLEQARSIGNYYRLDLCDASEYLPYDDNQLDLVFDNSAIEHFSNLDGALQEISRVLGPGGCFAFNVLNHRYFEWWPFDETSMKSYRNWQPFYHALSLDEWVTKLWAFGLEVVDHSGYFDKDASRELARLDYLFSGSSLAGRRSPFVTIYNRIPSSARKLLRNRLSKIRWQTEPDKGAGFFIQALKSHE